MSAHVLAPELRVVEYQNEWIVRSRWPFAYERWDAPALAQLRERFRLDEVVRSGASEWEQVLLLRDWVHARWAHGWSTANLDDAREILAKAEQGHDFSCGYYNTTLLATDFSTPTASDDADRQSQNRRMPPLRIIRVGPSHPHAAGIHETLRQIPEVEVVGTCEAAELGRTLRDLRPDAAIITLPADETPTAVARAAEARVHVYADKPVARSAAELAPAVDAVRGSGILTSHGYLRRSMPAGIAIRELVDAGVLGRLVSIEARWITTSVARRGPGSFYFDRGRSGGGMLNWLGCHYVDYMRWVSSAEVVEVAAVTATLSDQPIDVEDVATLALRYSNGMVGSLHCGYVTDRDTDQAFRLRGSLGWVKWDDAGPQVDARSVHASWSAAPSRAMRFEVEPLPGYGGGVGVAAFRRFFAACRGASDPVDSIEDALRVLETLDAAHEAARTGRTVKPERRA